MERAVRIDSKLTRRQLLRLSAGSLLAAGVWPGVLAADLVRRDLV